VCHFMRTLNGRKMPRMSLVRNLSRDSLTL